MPISEYSKTRLGDALKLYKNLREKAVDNYIEDESIFESPAEKKLYNLLIQTELYRNNRDKIRLIAQFPIGEYITNEYRRYIPKYRVDFLMIFSANGKEQSLILEYDGVEFHTKDPDIVTKHNFPQQYLEYDLQRQLELESYGYHFLRINKFNLIPENESESQMDVLNRLLKEKFILEG
jgi:very-short-patch-repair endonuclease